MQKGLFRNRQSVTLSKLSKVLIITLFLSLFGFMSSGGWLLFIGPLIVFPAVLAIFISNWASTKASVVWIKYYIHFVAILAVFYVTFFTKAILDTPIPSGEQPYVVFGIAIEGASDLAMLMDDFKSGLDSLWPPVLTVYVILCIVQYTKNLREKRSQKN